jgi:hypothetical protein
VVRRLLNQEKGKRMRLTRQHMVVPRAVEKALTRHQTVSIGQAMGNSNGIDGASDPTKSLTIH